MESILKSDIFFFVTTIVVAALGIALAIAIIYLIRILRDVKEISKEVKDETKQIVSDVSTFRNDIKSGATAGRVVKSIGALFKRRKKGRNHE